MSYNYISPLSIEEHPVEVVDGIKEAAEEMGAAVGKAFDDEVRKQVVRFMVKCDVKIDEQELLKALEYDRGQYEQGYADGKADSRKVGWWIERTYDSSNTIFESHKKVGWGCSECGLTRDARTHFCPNCGAKMEGGI